MQVRRRQGEEREPPSTEEACKREERERHGEAIDILQHVEDGEEGERTSEVWAGGEGRIGRAEKREEVRGRMG